MLSLSLSLGALRAEDIINLPNEVLSSPMGGMLRPVLEQMTAQVSSSINIMELQQAVSCAEGILKAQGSCFRQRCRVVFGLRYYDSVCFELRGVMLLRERGGFHGEATGRTSSALSLSLPAGKVRVDTAYKPSSTQRDTRLDPFIYNKYVRAGPRFVNWSQEHRP